MWKVSEKYLIYIKRKEYFIEFLIKIRLVWRAESGQSEWRLFLVLWCAEFEYGTGAKIKKQKNTKNIHR